MSRIGKKAIKIPDGVKFKVENSIIKIESGKGKLEVPLFEGVEVKEDDGEIKVTTVLDNKKTRAMHGTIRSLVNNMVLGLSSGFTKELEINGVGFKAAVQGSDLNLSLGFSHPILHPIPSGIDVKVEKGTQLKIQGINKQLVGQFAADVRSYYPPEPYKGKGIKYSDEIIRRKVGKSVK